MIRRAPVLAAALALHAGCGPGEAARPPERSPLGAKVAGCSAVRAGPICEVPPAGATLQLWLPAEGGEVKVTVGGAEAAAKPVGAAGGQRVLVALPAAAEGAAREVDVCVLQAARRACRSLVTEVVVPDERLVAAAARRTANDPEGALAALAGIEGPEASRARAGSLRARIALARGETAIALEGLDAGMQAHLAAGRLSDAVLDALALAYTLVTRRHAFGRALATLDRASEAAAAWDEGAAQIDYYRALALRDSGRPREALAALDRSARLASELGLSSAHRHAREVEARIAQSLGRHADAARTFADLVSGLGPDEGPCVRAGLMSAQTWSELTAVLAGAVPAAPPGLGARLEETLRLFEGPCRRPADAEAVTVNLSLFALLSGDPRRADELLRSLGEEGRERAAYVEVWRLDLAGRIALARGAPRDALAAYDALVKRSRAALSPEPLLRGLVGRGRSLASLGSREEAARAFSEAEDLLDAELGRLPAGEERALFLDEQGISADALIELLASAGRVDAALAAARRARSRNVRAALRMETVAALGPDRRAAFEEALARYRAARATLALGEEQAWARPKDTGGEARAAREAASRAAREALDEAFAIAGDAPSPSAAPDAPPPGEAWLLLHPRRDGATRVLARGDGKPITFVVTVSPDAPAEAVAKALLDPLDEVLAGARRVRVLASGRWQTVDLHALPFHGQPLVARATVVYSLDLPPQGARAGESGAPALIVSNPEEDLPGALREADAARGRLRSTRQIVELTGGGATKGAFVDALGRASWLHFAGHGRYGADWETGLRLGEGVVFTVRDALAMERAPGRVVLSGCETARTPPTRSLDIGLPEAFVVRGAEEVVAAVRPVGDAVAADLIAGLYATSPPDDLATGLARAQRGAWERAAPSDWAAYRVIAR